MDIRRKHRSDCEHVNVIRTSRVLSPEDQDKLKLISNLNKFNTEVKYSDEISSKILKTTPLPPSRKLT